MAAAIAKLPPNLLPFLTDWPALPPPTGVQPNFVNPPDRGPSTVPVIGVFMGLALIFYSARVYTKIVLVRRASWDDCEYFIPV